MKEMIRSANLDNKKTIFFTILLYISNISLGDTSSSYLNNSNTTTCPANHTVYQKTQTNTAELQKHLKKTKSACNNLNEGKSSSFATEDKEQENEFLLNELDVEEKYYKKAAKTIENKQSKNNKLSHSYVVGSNALMIGVFWLFPDIFVDMSNIFDNYPVHSNSKSRKQVSKCTKKACVNAVKKWIRNFFVNPFNLGGITQYLSYNSPLLKWFLSKSKSHTLKFKTRSPQIQLYAVKEKIKDIVKENTLSQKDIRSIEDILDQVEELLEIKTSSKEGISSISFGFTSHPDDGKREDAFKKLQKVLAIASLPRKAERISPTKLDEVKNLLTNVSDEVRSPLEQLTKKIIYQSSLSEQHKIKLLSRTNLFFVGPSGVGKTELVKEYAKTMGIPLYRVELSFKNMNLFESESHYSDTKNKLNPLAKSFLKVPSKKRNNNGIIFFENIDQYIKTNEYGHNSKALLDFLKNLLNKDNKYIQIPGLKTTIDISRFTVILSGSSRISDDALMSHLTTVEFEGFTFEKRKTIADDYFQTLLCQYDIEALDHHFNVIDKITALDHERSLGANNLKKTIEGFVLYLAQEKFDKLFFNKQTNTISDDHKDLSFDYKKHYEQNAKSLWNSRTAIALSQRNIKKAFLNTHSPIDLSIRDKTESIVNELIATANLAEDNSRSEYIKSKIRTINFLLKIPREIKAIEKEDLDNLEKSLQHYDEELIKEVIETLSYHQIISQLKNKNSVSSNTATKYYSLPFEIANGRSPIMFFQGPPGTGKTHLARQIAKSLKLPFIKIPLSVDHMGYKKLLHGNTGQTKTHQGLSLLTQSLLSKDGDKEFPKNAVIFIDEIDKVLNHDSPVSTSLRRFFHEFLDPSFHTLELKDLNVDIDISNYLIILAGNKFIKENGEKNAKDSASILSRIESISFKPYKRETLELIAKEYYHNLSNDEEDKEILNEQLESFIYETLEAQNTKGEYNLRKLISKIKNRFVKLKQSNDN